MVHALLGLSAGCEPASPPEPSVPPAAPVAVAVPTATVVRARPGRPEVPPDLEAEGWALVDLRVETTTAGLDRRRALLRMADGSTRAFAVGDLLPDRSVLTAIAPGEIRWFSEGEVHALRLGGAARIEERLELARRGRRRARRPDPTRELRPVVARAVRDLGAPDPALVQAAFRALVQAGEIAVPLLIEHLTDASPVASPSLRLAGRPCPARVVADRVVSVLEASTGQRLGDPCADPEGARRAWRRWAGAP